ncbi:MAG: hypothetical protein KGL33_02120 [Betaproteobacteria bacterium]|nr:hypothetical protein [Betaproteobacteria bacterium]
MLLSQRSLGHFDRALLPDPASYYTRELGALKGPGAWKTALCPFHEDTSPSLSVKTASGGYCCHACGAKGGDVLAFHMARHGLSFKDACKALGCWVEGAR